MVQGAMRCSQIQLLLQFCLTYTAIALDEKTKIIITSFIRHNHIQSAVIASCWNQEENVEMIKYAARKNIMVAIYDPGAVSDTSRLLKSPYSHIAVIVDLQCDGSISFIADAYKHYHLKLLHHWLLLQKYNESLALDKLSSLELLVDSQVSILHYKSEENVVMLQEVYRLRKDEPLKFTDLQEWVPEQKLPPKQRRDNFDGMALKTAVVLRNKWELFLDKRFRHKDSVGKSNYVLMTLLAEMLNFTMNLTFTTTWGFPKNGTECYDGAVGLLQCGDAEIGALGILYKIPRMERVDYAGDTFSFEMSFKFLKPSLSEVSIIYTLPFSRSVWLTYLLFVALMGVALFITESVESKMNPHFTEDPPKVQDATMYAFAIMCGEGTPRSPETMSSRIVFLFFLLLALFLETSYSAIIVSLLQTPSEAINTLTELIDGPFKLTMKDIPYNVDFVNDTTDPEIRRLYNKKLFSRPFHDAFVTEEKGVESLRHGQNAFYTDSTGYKVMSDTFEEHEKCRLKEIVINPSNILGFPIKKKSPYREMITRKARILKEFGMMDREYNMWFEKRPKCGGNSQGFVSVRIKDFYPTLIVLSIGSICSILVFSMELLYHKINHGNFWPTVSAIDGSTS